MITLACAKCGATLTVDDGFAGGTCRCATCGTIQTVPAKDASASDRVFGGASKPIFERTGDMAVASSVPRGPVTARSDDEAKPRAARASRPPPTPGRRRPKVWPVILLVGVPGAVAIAMAVLLWKRLDRVVTGVPVVTEPLVIPATRRTAPPLTEGPRFGSVRLDGKGAIVYLIDRDPSTAPFGDGIRRATLASLATLPAARPTVVRFWSAGEDSRSRSAAAGEGDWADFLADWPTPAATDAAASVRAAIGAPADEIVLITGQGWRADERMADEVLALLRDRRVKVHTVSLGTADARGPMARIAGATGGEAVALTVADLDRLGSPER